MSKRVVIVGIMQRNFPINPLTMNALNTISANSIIVDSSPSPVVKGNEKVTVIHCPDYDGFFPIALLAPLFKTFLSTSGDILFLIEGDMVLTEDNIRAAEQATENTKAFYKESDPNSPHAYVRREGLAGVLMRSEVQRIYSWMDSQPLSRFRRYEGYCDTFLWFAVSSETTGYTISTSGDWIPVLHITHDDSTRVTKAQRRDMKLYRKRLAEIISLAIECNSWECKNS